MCDLVWRGVEGVGGWVGSRGCGKGLLQCAYLDGADDDAGRRKAPTDGVATAATTRR